MFWIDHVLFGVRDLDVAGDRLRERHGLASVPGGRHRGWGTANRIVPLGRSYVELIGIVDPETARANFPGGRLEEQTASGDRLIGWCVGTDRLDAVADRLGLQVDAGSRERPDHMTMRWRSAGFEAAMTREVLPFFISWQIAPAEHPGHMEAAHAMDVEDIGWIELAGNEREVLDWLDGGSELPIRFISGSPGVRAVGITTRGGDEIVLP
jgi:hypothetical protein